MGRRDLRLQLCVAVIVCRKDLGGHQKESQDMVHRMRQADLLFHLQQDKRQQTGTGMSRERILCALMRSRATAIRHGTERKNERQRFTVAMDYEEWT